ncbi:tetratricopeptide repeat protein, partial [bacterium]|nr:tetratricopeptide repeat protein [bacterium]
MRKVFLYSFIFLLLFSFPLEGQRISGIDVLGYGRKLFDEGFYKIALMEFSQFLSDSPRSDEAYIAQYYIGECYFLLEDYEKADEAFLILTARYPHSPNVMLGWDGRGKCYEKMNDFKKAAEVFETAGNFFFYKGDAASPFFLYAGRNYLKINNLSKAQENFLRIIDNYPGGNEAYEAIYELALIRLGEGDINTALKEFEKLKYISELPDIAGRARFHSGRLYRGIGDYKKSEYEFLQVIEKFGNDKNLLVNAQLNLGITYLKGKAPQKARDILKKVIQTENLPDSLIIRSMITIGESYFYELNYTESVFQFEEIIKKFPNSTMIDEVFYRLGLCFEDEGNYEQALYHFRRSVEYEPGNRGFSDFQRRALDKLIHLYQRTGRYDEVGYYLERSSQRKENNELLLLKTAQIFEKGSQYQKAGRIYTVLRDRFPKSQHIDYYAFRNGVCFEKAGLIEKSLAIYKGILNDYPGCDFTEEILFKNTILERILKNYGGEISINAGRDVQKDKGLAALSYDLNAYNFYLDGETGKYYAYLDSAYAAYGTIIEEGGFSKDILDFAKVRIAEIFILRESDLLERKKKGIEYYTILMEDNSFSMREFALYRLGEIFANPGYPEAVEIPKSGGLNDLQQGREYYLQLMERYPNSIYLER